MNRLKKPFWKRETEMLPNPPTRDAYQFIWEEGLPFLCCFLVDKPSSLWQARAIQAFNRKEVWQGIQADIPAGQSYNLIYSHLQKVSHTIYS